MSTTDDPYHGRRPTSHERMTGEPWDASYSDGPAPWQIGQPQPAIVRLAAKGVFVGPVLDAGCGSGENTLHIAALSGSVGVSVLGVDVAKTALALGRKKAEKLGVEAAFATADAFHLDRLERSFQTVLDCGLFHTFESDEQLEYATSLASITRRDGTLYLLCFGDDGPDLGPHPVRREELAAAFHAETGWKIVAIETERIETIYHADGVTAWLATVRRL